MTTLLAVGDEASDTRGGDTGIEATVGTRTADSPGVGDAATGAGDGLWNRGDGEDAADAGSASDAPAAVSAPQRAQVT
jgi:hypothetical protein